MVLAWNDRLERATALKMLTPDDKGRFAPSAITRMREEAALLERLRHPAIARLYETIETETVKALALEYIDGFSLEAFVRSNGPPQADTLLRWTRQLCQVLAYLHHLTPSVIYRDLKPGNVMVTREDERLVLIDFGNAKTLGEHGRRSTRTTARGVLTRGFAAIEQYIGGTDARSDIYALGVTLHVLACGLKPPEALAIASGQARLADLRTLRDDLPPALLQAIEAMTQTDRALRPPNVEAVLERLGLDPLQAPSGGASEPSAPETLVGGSEPLRPLLSPSDGLPTEQAGEAPYDPSHPTRNP